VTGYVSHDPSLFGDVLLQYRHDGRGLEIVNDDGPSLLRFPINQGQDFHLMVIRTLLRTTGFAAYEGLVCLHDTTTTPEGR